MAGHFVNGRWVEDDPSQPTTIASGTAAGGQTAPTSPPGGSGPAPGTPVPQPTSIGPGTVTPLPENDPTSLRYIRRQPDAGGSPLLTGVSRVISTAVPTLVGATLGTAAAPGFGTTIGGALGAQLGRQTLVPNTPSGAQLVPAPAPNLGPTEARSGAGHFGTASPTPGTSAPPAPGGGVNLSGTTADLLNRFENSAPRTAPQTMPGQATASQTAAAQVGPAATISRTEVGPAAQATAAQAATPGAVTAPTIGPAAQAVADKAAQTQVDQAAADALRARQVSALGMTEAAANGTGGPTAAEALHQKAVDQAIASRLALVAGAHGTGRVGAQLKAGSDIAQITGQAAADAAALRAQEQQAARGQLLQALEGARGQDIGLATTNANLTQGANLVNAQLGTGVNTSNAAQANQVDLTRAEQQLKALQGNQSTAAQVGIANMQGQNTVAVANEQARNQLTALQAQIASQEGIATAEQQNELTKLQAQLANTTNIANMQGANQVSTANAGFQTQAGIANTDAVLRQTGLDDQARAELLHAFTTGSTAQLSADTQLKIASMNQATQQAIARTALAGAAIGGGGALLAALIPALLPKSGGAGAAGGAPTLPGFTYNPSTGQYVYTGTDATENGLEPPPLDPGGVTTPESSGTIDTSSGPTDANGDPLLMSDRRAKKGVRPLYSDERGKLLDKLEGDGGKDEIAALLEALRPASFRYKDPGADGASPGRQFGVMAQDLEKSPVGKTVVIEDKGAKKIDPTKAVGVLLATAAAMHGRLKKLEKRA